MASRLSRALRSPPSLPATRSLLFHTTTEKTASSGPSRALRRFGPPRPHEYSKPTEFLGSWNEPAPSSNPREALKRLEGLRRDYERQVKECRKQYMYEMELQRQERVRKEEARKEAARLAKEERRAAKKEADEARAARHRAFQEELRHTLLKERAEKLENWRAKEALREKKKSERCDLLVKQSSMWIDEHDLEKKIRDAVIDTQPLSLSG